MPANKNYPRRLDHKRWARNRAIPDVGFLNHLVTRQNHIMAYRRKSFFRASDVPAAFVGVGGATVLYRFRCHTGHGATHIGFVLGIGAGKTEPDPYVQIDVTIAGGATTTLEVHAGANLGSATDSPSEIIWREPRVPVAANTTYEVAISVVDEALLVSACAYEVASPDVDDAVDYYNELTGSVEQPVFDSIRENVLVGLSQMWRHNGSQLYTYPGSGSGVGTSYTSTTWTNIIDGATTSSASTAGIYLGNGGGPSLVSACRLSDSATLNIVLAVHCSVASSAVGQVRLWSEDLGISMCSITGMGTAAGWYTATTTIATDEIDKLDVQARVSTSGGSIEMTLNAISIYEYLA